MRGADCTVPSNEMARVDRWRKLLVNIVIGVILDGNLYLGYLAEVGWVVQSVACLGGRFHSRVR